MIFIEKGNFYLGYRTIDDNGNLIQYRPKFKPNNNGNCVVVGMLDPKTKEQVGEPDVFTDFNAKGYLTKILELLSPEKNKYWNMKINIIIAALLLIVNISFILTFIYYCKLPQPKMSDDEHNFNKCDFKVINIIKNQQVTGK